MSKLMLIIGIILAAVAVALGLMIFVSPATVVGWGFSQDTAAILLVGGILSIGLGGVIQALEHGVVHGRMPAVVEETTAAPIPQFGRKAAEATATASAAGAVAASAAQPEVSPAVSETIKALEEAKQDIQQAFGGEQPEDVVEREEEDIAEMQEPEIVEEEAVIIEEEVAEDDTGLYVVEERMIRSRPARILSDGTVEAETDEGWMRFENLEHLDEYLDAMTPHARA